MHIEADGGPGDDRVTSGTSRDFLDGGSGDDRLSSGPSDDELQGGPGRDVLVGGSGYDRLDGEPGRDVLHGGGGGGVLRSGIAYCGASPFDVAVPAVGNYVAPDCEATRFQ